MLVVIVIHVVRVGKENSTLLPRVFSACVNILLCALIIYVSILREKGKLFCIKSKVRRDLWWLLTWRGREGCGRQFE